MKRLREADNIPTDAILTDCRDRFSGSQVKSSQVAFNKNKWQSHEFCKQDKWIKWK